MILGGYDTRLDAYENTTLQSIQKYIIEQFRFWTEDEFVLLRGRLSIWKICFAN